MHHLHDDDNDGDGEGGDDDDNDDEDDDAGNDDSDNCLNMMMMMMMMIMPDHIGTKASGPNISKESFSKNGVTICHPSKIGISLSDVDLTKHQLLLNYRDSDKELMRHC